MKKILPIFIPLSLLVVWFMHGSDLRNQVTYQEGDLQPSALQRKVESKVFEILSNYHYRKIPVNDSLSSKIFDAYIKQLDPNKVFFLAEDLNEIEKYRFAIDEALTLAKELSTDESAGYIHGVLGRISSIKESIAI